LLKDIPTVTTDIGAKNIVLMIGDGMGADHIKTANAYFGYQSYMESLSKCDGLVSTFSKSVGATDSAAAATALSAGYKVNNGQLNWHKGKNLQTISEFAHENKMKTGVITTEDLFGATPAGFSAHSGSRNSTDTIIKSQLVSGVNLFMGMGISSYDKHSSLIAQSGYKYIRNLDALEDAKIYDKILALFGSLSIEAGSSETPTLAMLSIFALGYLSEQSGGDGFFLMIEGAHIDKRSHPNDMKGMLDEFRGFDDAVKEVVEWADDNGETMVIVTADHETGGLKYNGEVKEEISNNMFTSGGHTSADVRFFFYGITVSITDFQGRKIDNTNISDICRQTISNYRS